MTPAFPYQGALIQILTVGVAPGFEHSYSAASPRRRSCAPSEPRHSPRQTSTRFRDGRCETEWKSEEFRLPVGQLQSGAR